MTVGPATPFKEVAARLAEHRVSAVPVVDDDGRVLGVVSEADLLLKEEFPDPDQDIPLFWTSGAAWNGGRRPARQPATSCRSRWCPSRPMRRWPRRPGGCMPPGSSGYR